MKMIYRLVLWLWRAWPLFILLAILWLQASLVEFYPQESKLIHSSFSLVAQIVGGLLVLYTIDSNLGVLKDKKFFSLVSQYFEEFPLWRRPVVLSANGVAATATVGKAKLRVKRNPNTVEEKLDYLQAQIDEVRREFESDLQEVERKIDKTAENMRNEIRALKQRSNTIENKIKQVSVGSLKVQVLGVSLMIYGSVSGYIA